jgi:squalene-hopene cyclase-like protein
MAIMNRVLNFVRRTVASGYALWFVTVLCISTGNPARVIATEPSAGLRAGAYAIDITPRTFPVSSTPHHDNQVSEVHDRLHARCLVLDDDRTRIAIVVADNNMVPRQIFDAAKAKAEALTGIPAQNMLMSATHTHTAVTVAGISQSKIEKAYVGFLADRIAEGIKTAVSQLEPARVGWGVGSDPSQVFNRRWFMKPGYEFVDPLGLGTDKVKMNPGRAHPDLLKPAGPVDPQVSLLSVQARDGRPIALLANYSLHYVGGVPDKTLSADYFGEFARQITRRIGAEDAQPPFVAAMSNGTSADINNIDFRVERPRREPFEQIRIVANSVADAAYDAYQKIQYVDDAPLEMRETEIELGVRLPSAADVVRAKEHLAKAGPEPYHNRDEEYSRETILLARYPPVVKVKLQAIRIGNLGIASSPCETFVETGLAIKKQSPLEQTFVIELANGYNGYVPTPEQHRLGGYETWRARSSYLEVNASTKVQATLLRLLGEVAAEPIRDEFSARAAVEFLDAAALSWQNDHNCFACHSDYAFLYTRPVVDWKAPVHGQIRSKLEHLAEHPRDTKYRETEAVMTASMLAQNDALTTGKLHPSTRKALGRMWAMQREDGGFEWMKYDQPPSEMDDHYGVTVAAIGVGSAPDGYAETPAARSGLDGIRRYFRDNPPANLHHRAMKLLASLNIDGIMSAEERGQVVQDLFALQKPDGGWGLATYGNWERSDGKAQDLDSSDGYGTGFAIYVLRRAGIPAGQPQIRHGITWLKTHQRASGGWFTRSLWKDQKHYLSRAGTAYAILALAACDEL